MTIEQYGLSAPPFQLTPDPRFWFESATHKKAMAYLGYGLQQGEGFIVVTGEIGAGKTTLVGHLLALIDPARVAAVNIVSSQLGGDDVLRLVGQGLGINVSGLEKAELLVALEQQFAGRARSGQRTLVIVDEAQGLSHEALEELRMLSNFQGRGDAPGKALVQMLLLGQPEFRDMLNTAPLEQLRQRVISSHHLTGMSVEEVGAYINHRLALVGWQGRPTFLPEAVAAIHGATGGIPRMVNQIAQRTMLLSSMENALAIDPRMVAMVVAELEAESPHMAYATGQAPAVSEPVEAVHNVASLDAAARLAMLEAQVSEQDAALRRMLTLMIDWVEGESNQTPVGAMKHAPAA
jgi:general secretion pathway protein A